ncbi:hypothetical protein K435DRAFT_191891 [Dendrothele bispora CBS 962.96]|uniref:Uncharacterized protein n=1 Tax=Dendrothele bispora (strain CBS 962.96) TaxID=1314807 RepID=A0A4V4HF38_DENBC|nr:hypothetical protein K435DRAFT_191891 [Dendrothele bispora CBS 962.96]
MTSNTDIFFSQESRISNSTTTFGMDHDQPYTPLLTRSFATVSPTPDTGYHSQSSYNTPTPSMQSTAPMTMTPQAESFDSPFISSPAPSVDLSPTNSDPNTEAFTTAVLPVSTIDNLASQFKLTKVQRANCHLFVQIGSQPPALTCSDMSTRLFLLATMYAKENKDDIRNQVERTEGASDYKGLLDDMKSRMSGVFTLTQEQQMSVRVQLADMLFEKSRTSFCKIHIDAKLYFKRDKVFLKLENVIGDTTREKILNSRASRIGSRLRHQMMNEIYQSISGPTRKPVHEFAREMGLKYMRGGPGSTIEKGFIAHKAILRRFAREHPELHGKSETERADNDDDSHDFRVTSVSDRDADEPPTKRPKTSKPKAKHFWGAVDEWFVEQLDKRGNNFNTVQWQTYINETMTIEEKLFSKDSDECKEPLPLRKVPVSLSRLLT